MNWILTRQIIYISILEYETRKILWDAKIQTMEQSLPNLTVVNKKKQTY